MTIAILGTPAHQGNNTSYTAETGTNRVVVAMPWSRRTGAVSVTQTVWNSITRSPTITGDDFGGDDRSGTGISIFKESEIGSASSMNNTWESAPSTQGQVIVTVDDVDQSTTVRAGSPTGFGGTTAVALTIPNVSVGDLLLAVCVNRNGATYTVNNSWTQLVTGTNGDGGRYIYCYKIATGSNDNFSLTMNAGDGWQASAVALIQNGGTSTTVTPAQAALTLNGRTPTTSAFQNVRIREVLVNGSGQVVGNASDITLLVWYSGRFGGAPDLSLNSMTTDPNGTTSWSIATGTLAFNDPIAYVAQNSVSLSHYAAARMIPNYE